MAMIECASAEAPQPSFEAFYATMKDQPIYVVLGVQGSGTNLLRSILVAAFDFVFIQDQSLIYNAAAALGSHPSPEMVRRQFEFICSRLFPTALTRKTRRLIKSNGSFDGIQRSFDHAGITSGPELAHFVYSYAAFSRGTRLVAIKSDDLSETIDRIDAVLPTRRILLLTRDFRDNLLSITKKDFGPVEPLVAAQYVKGKFARYDAEYRRTPATTRLHVRYEDLLEAPDEFVDRFAQQFGLASDGAALRPVDRGRIRSNNMKKWAALSPRRLAQCEAILAQEMRAYGYAADADPVPEPGPGTWLLVRTHDTASRIPQKLRKIATRWRR
jgi:hypothetical protein